MSHPPIFILKTAEEGALLEREAILATMNRWADEMGSAPRLKDAGNRIRQIAEVIRRGEHHRPIDTAPRRRMTRRQP